MPHTYVVSFLSHAHTSTQYPMKLSSILPWKNTPTVVNKEWKKNKRWKKTKGLNWTFWALCRCSDWLTDRWPVSLSLAVAVWWVAAIGLGGLACRPTNGSDGTLRMVVWKAVKACHQKVFKAPFGFRLLKFNSHHINVPLNVWSTKCRLIVCISAHMSSNLRDESIKSN
jgi:hypothetical protein